MFKFLKKIFRGPDSEQPTAPTEQEQASAQPAPTAADGPTSGVEIEPEATFSATPPAAVEPPAALPEAIGEPVTVPVAPLSAAPPPLPADGRGFPTEAPASPTARETPVPTAPATERAAPDTAGAPIIAAPAPAAVAPSTDSSVAERARPPEPPRAAAATPAATSAHTQPPAPAWGSGPSLIGSALVRPLDIPAPSVTPIARERWSARLKAGLRKTGSNLSGVFTGAQITESLYDDLESALLLADTGVPATQLLLTEVRRRVRAGGATHPIAVRNALIDALTQLLKPLEKELVIGQFTPTVIMVAGVNGAGKTTSIGKLTKHLANEGAAVLLAAADTFRAAAREQLGVWADRNLVEIVAQEGGDPAAVSFDAVTAAKARGKDVVLVDTAGRLPTQLHLMEELKKIKRVVQKAEASAPHEVLLVIDGNTGQNALAQVKAFDAALGLTGLVVTKLDGTAKGGVLAAIAQWGAERARTAAGGGPVPVYFIGVGEKLEDLETFNAREFAQALLE